MTISDCAGCKWLAYKYIENRENMYYTCDRLGLIVPEVRTCPGKEERQ